MSRRSTRRARRGRGGAPAERTAAPARRPAVALAIVMIAVIAAALWIAFSREVTDGPARTAPAAGRSPWGPWPAGMGPVEAYTRGAALADSGRALEALPYLHYATRQPGAPWQAWRAFGAALFNASMANPSESRAVWPGTRSSVARVHMMRLAIACFTEAERLAPGPAERALVTLTRAQGLKTWGFPWDALRDYHEAARLDAQWATYPALYARALRDPESSGAIW